MRPFLLITLLYLALGVTSSIAQRLMDGSRRTVGYIEGERVMDGSRRTVGNFEGVRITSAALFFFFFF
jgi:hypothetical protein